MGHARRKRRLKSAENAISSRRLRKHCAEMESNMDELRALRKMKLLYEQLLLDHAELQVRAFVWIVADQHIPRAMP